MTDSDDDVRRRLPGFAGLQPPASSSNVPWRLRSQRQSEASRPSLPFRTPSDPLLSHTAFEPEHEEAHTASSSALNSRRPFFLPRRPIVRLRQPSTGSGDTVPSSSATSSVDRRHVSWEAPSTSRDSHASTTHQYLSALSRVLDSDIPRGEALPSPPLPSPPLPMWGENSETPYSSLFARSPVPPRHSPVTVTRVPDTPRVSSVPSLPPPDLGGEFERGEDMLRSASSFTTFNPSEMPVHAIRPPTPPSRYTGPFRLTMQRRDEGLRRAAGAARRLPETPSIPPLGFSHTLEGSSTAGPSQDSSSGQTERSRILPPHPHPRPLSYHSGSLRGESSSSSRFVEAERRLFSYAGPGRSSQPQSPDEDPRRFFPSRPTPTSSTSNVDPLVITETPLHARRYSATDMHNVLARQARLVGSRLADDVHHTPYRPASDSNPADSSFEYAASRAQRLISQYHARAEADDAEPSSSSSSSPWASLPPRRTRDDVIRAEVQGFRRRRVGSRGFMSGMGEAEPPQLRHRALRGDFRGEPALNSMFTRLRRGALGDYMRDEDFDSSYETLLSLGGWIGDARPKATPDNVLSSLETATYKDWATTDSDQRCPICLDDYKPTDRVMKLGDCRHWLHKECLEQWLKGANTCPVCRNAVKGKSRQRPQRHHHHPHPGAGPSRRRDDSDPDGGGGPSTSGIGGSGGGSGGDIPHTNWLNFLRD
ncbi:RING-type domain-containing protein [Favolaschia claudopus]|uniref:RING-type E3 ubiquitin transferase n=1 Tax=Favolaschia claudopus TaxID=2862362 RepID=A0AAW0DRD8_9AGAR